MWHLNLNPICGCLLRVVIFSWGRRWLNGVKARGQIKTYRDVCDSSRYYTFILQFTLAMPLCCSPNFELAYTHHSFAKNKNKWDNNTRESRNGVAQIPQGILSNLVWFSHKAIARVYTKIQTDSRGRDKNHDRL